MTHKFDRLMAILALSGYADALSTMATYSAAWQCSL